MSSPICRGVGSARLVGAAWRWQIGDGGGGGDASQRRAHTAARRCLLSTGAQGWASYPQTQMRGSGGGTGLAP